MDAERLREGLVTCGRVQEIAAGRHQLRSDESRPLEEQTTALHHMTCAGGDRVAHVDDGQHVRSTKRSGR